MRGIIAAALLVSSVPAHANWQFTKWGMTPAQVVAASGGKAAASTADQIRMQSTPGHIAKLAMPYWAANSQFTAYFCFGPADKLIEIELESADGVNGIIPALTSKYGAPISDDGTAGLMRIAKWQTRTDEIIATQFSAIGDSPARASITYSSRNSADTKGL